jgi:CubicO group peptidase (beta-lactamase class C family)
MERISAQQLAEWVAEARKCWSAPGMTAGLFRIASITKPFTATLALTLAARVQ